MYFDVIGAEYKEDYKIFLRFEDGSSGVADLSSYPNPKNVFKAFLDLECFKNFRIEYGTLVWGDGGVDIAPETLYAMATGKSIKYRTIEKSA